MMNIPIAFSDEGYADAVFFKQLDNLRWHITACGNKFHVRVEASQDLCKHEWYADGDYDRCRKCLKQKKAAPVSP